MGTDICVCVRVIDCTVQIHVCIPTYHLPVVVGGLEHEKGRLDGGDEVFCVYAEMRIFLTKKVKDSRHIDRHDRRKSNHGRPDERTDEKHAAPLLIALSELVQALLRQRGYHVLEGEGRDHAL